MRQYGLPFPQMPDLDELERWLVFEAVMHLDEQERAETERRVRAQAEIEAQAAAFVKERPL